MSSSVTTVTQMLMQSTYEMQKKDIKKKDCLVKAVLSKGIFVILLSYNENSNGYMLGIDVLDLLYIKKSKLAKSKFKE